MGLSPEYYNECTQDVLNLYAEIEDRIIADIVRRIIKTGDITETAKWQIRQAQQMGLLYDDIIKEVAKSSGKAEQTIKKMFENAGVETVNNDNRLHIQAGKSPLDIRQSESMLQILNGVYKNSLTDLKNLTGTTAITSQTAYYQACNSAFMMVSSGAFSYQQALRTVIQEVADKGATVSYPSGHIDKLDVAVRRSLLTGIGLASRQISEENSCLCECDLMEISAHSGARPSHAVWQGQIVSLSGRRGYLSKNDIGYGTGAGFGGWNCRHDWYPFYEGISTRNYTQSDLDKLNAKDIKYNGKMYSKYEISQMLRKKEREIRALKREKIAYKTAIEEGQTSFKSDLTTINGKIKDKSSQIQEFCNQTGYNRDRFREQVGGKTSVGYGAKNKINGNIQNFDYMSRFNPRYSNVFKIKIPTINNFFEIQTKRVSNSHFEMYADITADRKNKAIRLFEKMFLDVQNQLPKNFKIPPIVAVDFEKNGIIKKGYDLIGAYDKNMGNLFINTQYDTKEKLFEYVNRYENFANKTEYAVFKHELGHKYYEDCINSLAISKNMSYNEVKKIIDRKIYNYVENKKDYLFIQTNISIYAQDGYNKNSFTEVIAECFSVRDTNEIAKEILSLLEDI